MPCRACSRPLLRVFFNDVLLQRSVPLSGPFLRRTNGPLSQGFSTTAPFARSTEHLPKPDPQVRAAKKARRKAKKQFNKSLRESEAQAVSQDETETESTVADPSRRESKQEQKQEHQRERDQEPTQNHKQESRQEYKQEFRKEPWQIQKEALKNKFRDEGWNPRKKLSPDALEGIRTLHQQYPDHFTTPVLAQHFKVSPEVIRRVLRSKWRPSPEEEEDRRARWERRGQRIWEHMSELGVHPPKKWRQMGIGTGPRRGNRDAHLLKGDVERDEDGRPIKQVEMPIAQRSSAGSNGAGDFTAFGTG